MASRSPSRLRIISLCLDAQTAVPDSVPANFPAGPQLRRHAKPCALPDDCGNTRRAPAPFQSGR